MDDKFIESFEACGFDAKIDGNSLLVGYDGQLIYSVENERVSIFDAVAIASLPDHKRGQLVYLVKKFLGQIEYEAVINF